MTAAARGFVVVGDWMTDVVATLPGPLREGTDTHADVRVLGGGSAANTAAWLARAGHRTTFVARVGDDLLGRSGTAELERTGVVCRFAVDAVRPSGTCIVLVGPDGERTMVPDPGANQGLVPQDVPDDVLRADDHLHLSGYTVLVEGSRAAGLETLRRARAAGMTTSVDVASAGPLADAGASRFLSWVEGVDVLLANEAEAALLAGMGEPAGDTSARLAAAASAATSLSGRFPCVVVKVGARGALLRTSAGVGSHRPAVPTDVVDTTGAGDAFASAFLPAWLDGVGADTALAAGNAAAAVVVARVGARP